MSLVELLGKLLPPDKFYGEDDEIDLYNILHEFLAVDGSWDWFSVTKVFERFFFNSEDQIRDQAYISCEKPLEEYRSQYLRHYKRLSERTQSTLDKAIRRISLQYPNIFTSARVLELSKRSITWAQAVDHRAQKAYSDEISDVLDGSRESSPKPFTIKDEKDEFDDFNPRDNPAESFIPRPTDEDITGEHRSKLFSEGARDIQRKGKRKRFFNHLTISRDQTSAGDFATTLISVFFGLKQRDGDQKDDIANSIPWGPASRVLGPEKYSPNILHPETAQQADNTNNILAHQELRLNKIRQQISSPVESKSATMAAAQKDGSSKSCEILSNFHTTLGNEFDDIAFDRLPNIKSSHNSYDSPDILAQQQQYEKLQNTIATLKNENKNLKQSQGITVGWVTVYDVSRASPDMRSDPRVEQRLDPFMHQGMTDPSRNNLRTAYLDEPAWYLGPASQVTLRGQLPITDVNEYLRKINNVAFVVTKYYSSWSQHQEALQAAMTKRPLPEPEQTGEAILLWSPDMVAAAEQFFARQPHFSEQFPGLNIRAPIAAPYLFWYIYRSSDVLASLDQHHQDLMRLLTSWIDQNYGEKYDLADKHQKRGVISQETISYLVKPGEVLVWHERKELKAAIARSWLRLVQPRNDNSEKVHTSEKATNVSSKEDSKETSYKVAWDLDTWSFGYDGQFFRRPKTERISLKTTSPQHEVNIRSLNIYPLAFAEQVIQSKLLNRGHTFWNCRHQKLVSYEDEKGLYGSGERFMVDFQTYQLLHDESYDFKQTYQSIHDPSYERMSVGQMDSDDPPRSPDIYVFPNTIPGYNLRSKKWVDLEVDLIRDVTWNKKSFQNLVIDDPTKELIQALVNNQIDCEQGADIIHRKGNGLIILLHGAPGTGKTFTAESVAEMAEKPLFRVTCGDIGTKPELVEKYLESVLHLGTTWGCVVLIDEAEVFLEQRGLDNLERNALVSVFLRVLEYYEGILFLTSNRVGTFDEAFKSRILLSLHYENLEEGQRHKIWKNLLRRLKDFGQEDKRTVGVETEPGSRKRKRPDESTGIDFDDVECYLNSLAKFKLNGREIRNAITLARQLATSRGKPMAYEHLKHVIEVTSKFDAYLRTVQEGTDDEIAREDRLR